MTHSVIATLIPPPVKLSRLGNPLPFGKWEYHRSPAYEAAARQLLAPGWELYSVLDGEAHRADAARDFGATRLDSRAHVFGCRDENGAPDHLRASLPALGSEPSRSKVFEAHQVAEAIAWCEEALATDTIG